MFFLDISNDQLKKLERLGSDSPVVFRKVLNTALREAIKFLKKEDIKIMMDKYATTDTDFYKGSSFRTSVKNGEATLLASKKSNSFKKFNLSKKNPGKTARNMKVEIIKSNGKKYLKTAFWGNYKNGGYPQIFFRNGKESYKISPAYTTSLAAMGRSLDDDEAYLQIQSIFEKKLDEIIEKELL